jgi:hypothetical protein
MAIWGLLRWRTVALLLSSCQYPGGEPRDLPPRVFCGDDPPAPAPRFASGLRRRYLSTQLIAMGDAILRPVKSS